jgi:hypothetical protein
MQQWNRRNRQAAEHLPDDGDVHGAGAVDQDASKLSSEEVRQDAGRGREAGQRCAPRGLEDEPGQGQHREAVAYPGDGIGQE